MQTYKGCPMRIAAFPVDLEEHSLVNNSSASCTVWAGMFLHHQQSINTWSIPCDELHSWCVGGHIPVSILAKVSFPRCSSLQASSLQLNLRDNEEARKAEQKVSGHNTHPWTTRIFMMSLVFYEIFDFIIIALSFLTEVSDVTASSFQESHQLSVLSNR